MSTWGRPLYSVSIFARISTALARTLDAERGRWFFWLPVWFGAGIGVHFALPSEPPPLMVAAAVLLAVMLRIFLRASMVTFIAGSILLCMTCGFAAAQIRSMWVKSPILERTVRTNALEGWVELWEQSHPKRGRLTLRVHRVDGLAPEAAPYRVRIGVNAASAPRIGEYIALRAVLQPPKEPVMPGTYDFAQHWWFSSMGAGGYALGKPEWGIQHATAPPGTPFSLQIMAQLGNLRQLMTARVRAALPPQEAAVAEALISGERAQMSAADAQALRYSGLFHVLSVSGLHMALMGGFVFWTIRFVIALIPPIALRFATKKWAAAAAIGAVFFYYLISGLQIAALRSFIMIAVVFLAIILDRRAITQRNVAFSALIILALTPEGLMDISFQMSYAATAAIIAFYELFGTRLHNFAKSGRWRFAKSIFAIFLAAGLSSLAAQLSVDPFSVYHFHGYNPYAVLGNLLGGPIVDFIMMPMVLAALVAMPFGLEYWPLQIMGLAIKVLMVIVYWVAGLKGSYMPLPGYPLTALLLIISGGLWLIIWRTSWRYAGLAVIAAGLAAAPFRNRPDIFVDREAVVIAVRDPSGALQVSPGRKASYTVRRWLETDGDNRKPGDAAKQATIFRCDGPNCVAMVKGRLVSLTREPSALAEDCKRVDVLITPLTLTAPCPHPKLIIQQQNLRTGGAHTITFDGRRMPKAETVAEHRGVRPWAPERLVQETIQPLDNGTDDPRDD
jgi:competence protein ComEC